MTMSAGKGLIFGASGHIGGPVARFMRYKGWRERLRLATSRAAKLDQLRVSFPDCETVVADYLNIDRLNDALKGVRTVFVILPDFIDERVAISILINAWRNVPDSRQLVRHMGAPTQRFRPEAVRVGK